MYWKGGKYQNHGYVYILKPDHPRCKKNGYIMQHRLVWEEHNNAILLSWADVHHKNGIKDDNRIENLEATTHGSHTAYHNIGNKDAKKDMSDRICNICKSSKTFFHKQRKSNCWYTDPLTDEGFICSKCYHYVTREDRPFYSKKEIYQLVK